MFKNKTVLITGAAVGIGKACAIRFAESGANVVLVDVNEEALKKAEEKIKKITDSCLSVVCDVADNSDVTATVQATVKRFGKIDILINNAALWRSRTSFLDTEFEEWQKYFNINVFGTVHFTKAVLPLMIENNWGRIINIASVAGVYGNKNMVHYSSTKGAIISFTKALAKEIAANNITVNAVSPGTVSSSEFDDIDYVAPSSLSYCGRTGSGRENADLCLYLAGDSAAYISGQNIQIDGCRKNI